MAKQKLVTQEEAAVAVSRTVKTIERWRAAGLLRTWQRGRRVLVDLGEVQRVADPPATRKDGQGKHRWQTRKT